MNSETEQISRALMMLRGRFAGRLHELAAKMGISKQRLSAYLNGAIPTKRIERDILAIFAQEFTPETGASTASESTPPYRVEGDHQPIGHIPFEGRDWKMSVPVFADDALTQKMLAAARALVGKLPEPPPQAPPAGTPSAGPSVEEAVLLAEADRLGAQVRTMSTGTVTPAKP